MRDDLLDIQLKVLLLQHGRNRVLQSLARAGEVSEASIESQLAAVASAKLVKSRKPHPDIDHLLSRLQIAPGARESVATLAREFMNKRFLGELRLVEKFLREHGVQSRSRTRLDALPKILEVLVGLPEGELRELIADSKNIHGQSGYSQLAAAIMEPSQREHSLVH